MLGAPALLEALEHPVLARGGLKLAPACSNLARGVRERLLAELAFVLDPLDEVLARVQLRHVNGRPLKRLAVVFVGGNQLRFGCLKVCLSLGLGPKRAGELGACRLLALLAQGADALETESEGGSGHDRLIVGGEALLSAAAPLEPKIGDRALVCVCAEHAGRRKRFPLEHLGLLLLPFGNGCDRGRRLERLCQCQQRGLRLLGGAGL